MSDQTIRCPYCGHAIEITAALTQQVEAGLRQEYAEQTAAQVAEARRQAEQTARQAQLLERDALAAQVEARDQALAEARTRESDLLKRQFELEDQAKSLDLEVNRRLAAERQQIEQAATARLAEAHRVQAEEARTKDLEKDKLLTDMRRQIEDLKRRAEQGSQQTQGEALEEEIEVTLRAAFPLDVIEPVEKGIRGADLLQRVFDRAGKPCGAILWEFKNTKRWSDEWLAKLRDDQRQANADIAVLASAVLPEGLSNFGQRDGIWVTAFSLVISVASLLRAGLLQVAQARTALDGRNEKAELLYTYLTGTEFRQRVEAVVEAVAAMQADLASEKRAIEKLWAKREKQIERAIMGITVMHGEMQGVIGALPAIPALELAAPVEIGDDAEEPLEAVTPRKRGRRR